MGFFALIMISALVALSCALSTKEQRAAARVKFKPYSRWLWIAVAVVWVIWLPFIVWPRN